MITEQYVSFETAKLLKEKGFVDEYGEGYYTKKGEIQFQQLLSDLIEKEETYYCDAPTQSLVMRWLRESYSIFINIGIIPHSTVTMEQKYYYYNIFKDRRSISICERKKFYSTYEEAVEAAIKYCLNNLI